MILTEIHFPDITLPNGYCRSIYLPSIPPVNTTLRLSTEIGNKPGNNIEGCFKITSVGFDVQENYMILAVIPTKDWMEPLELF